VVAAGCESKGVPNGLRLQVKGRLRVSGRALPWWGIEFYWVHLAMFIPELGKPLKPRTLKEKINFQTQV
jgi:hypothetical protein